MTRRFLRLMPALLIAPVLLSAAGCNGEDADRLSRVAKVAGRKVEEATGGARLCLTSKLQSLQGEDSLAQHVRQRLQYDKPLENVKLEVEEADGVITVSGEVANAELKERAVGIAESTVGVEKVVDQVTVKQ